MADFSLAHPFVSVNEGGYVNDPKDKGGETYRGIARNFFPKWEGWPTVDSAKPLSKGAIIPNPALDARVDAFYKHNFWDDCLLDSVNSQGFATYFYDFHVTSGGNATKVLQRLLGEKVDGGFGPDTLKATNAYAGDLLLDFHNKRVEYYKQIGVGDNARFLQGWLNRANFMYDKMK